MKYLHEEYEFEKTHRHKVLQAKTLSHRRRTQRICMRDPSVRQGGEQTQSKQDETDREVRLISCLTTLTEYFRC